MKNEKLKMCLKIFLIVILVLLFLLIIHTVRNYNIISNLQEKSAKYENITNYHVKAISDQDNDTRMTIDCYAKDNKRAMFIERVREEKTTKLSFYDNGQRIDMFADADNEKTANIGMENNSMIMWTGIPDYLGLENNFQKWFSSIFARITSKEVNGKQCYKISNFISSSLLYEPGKNEMYIEKDTGLLIQTVTNLMVSNREYEFNNVEDSIFTEPDIGQYKIEKNN